MSKGVESLKNEKGFSLLEVVAAFVLITIILLSFYPLINNAKKVSASNIERLVVINLAEATLNRLKINKTAYIENPADNPSYLFEVGGKEGKEYSLEDCMVEKCKTLYTINLNGRNYYFKVQASQTKEDSQKNLISIMVTAKNEKGNISYSVEGYVSRYD